MGTNDRPSGSGLPPQEATTALKEGIVSGARDLTSEVKHIAGDVAGDAKKVAESKLGAGKDFAAEHLGAVAYALRQTSQQLRSEESGITEYVEKAAASVDDVSHYLQTRTLSQLIGDAEGYARREPAVFLGGAFFAGLLGGRFLKSATPSRASAGGSAGQGPKRPVHAEKNGSRPQLSQGTEPRRTAPQRTAVNGDKPPSYGSATSTPPVVSTPAGGPTSSNASRPEPQASTRPGKGPGAS